MVVWDILKAHLLIITQISAIKTKIKEWENLILSEAAKAEEMYVHAPTSDSARRWLEAQALYQQVSTTAAENKRFFMQQWYFNKGENTGHSLTIIARAQQRVTHIEAIQNMDGEMFSGQEQISAVFSHFFWDLYTSKVHSTKEALGQF